MDTTTAKLLTGVLGMISVEPHSHKHFLIPHCFPILTRLFRSELEKAQRFCMNVPPP